MKLKAINRSLTLGAIVFTLPCSSPAVAGPREFDQQIQADIIGTVEMNRKARSILELRQSGFTPEDVLGNVHAFHSREAWKALCQVFGTIENKDLALFEEVISRKEIDSSMPCSADLRTRIRTYWNEAKAKLRTKPKSLAKWKTEERSIDTELKAGEIALTFNDGPHPKYTPRILSILKSAGIRATFFEVGKNVSRNYELTQRAIKEGHTVGSHTQSHRILSRLSLKKAESEILEGKRTLEEATGGRAPLFRYPYSADSNELGQILTAQGVKSVGWTIDSLDWKLRNPEELLAHVLKEVERSKGGILLLHEDLEQTVLMLPPLLEELQSRGYTPVVFVAR